MDMTRRSSILNALPWLAFCANKATARRGWVSGILVWIGPPRKALPADEKAIDYTKRVGGGPADLGFDYFFGIPASLDMPPYVYVENDHVEASATGHVEERKGMEFYRGGPAAPGFKHEDVLPRLTEKAVACIEGHASARLKTPLFLYFALPAPHTPILPTPEFQGKSGIGPYGDFVHQVDWTIGQVLGALEKAGMAENTLFVVTSDKRLFAHGRFQTPCGAGPSPELRVPGT